MNTLAVEVVILRQRLAALVEGVWSAEHVCAARRYRRGDRNRGDEQRNRCGVVEATHTSNETKLNHPAL